MMVRLGVMECISDTADIKTSESQYTMWSLLLTRHRTPSFQSLPSLHPSLILPPFLLIFLSSLSPSLPPLSNKFLNMLSFLKEHVCLARITLQNSFITLILH